MGNLVKVFGALPYQSNREGHREDGVREALERLEELRPDQKEYWKLRGEILSCISLNATEQFSRGKYDAGLMSTRVYYKLMKGMIKKEERAGFEAEFF